MRIFSGRIAAVERGTVAPVCRNPVPESYVDQEATTRRSLVMDWTKKLPPASIGGAASRVALDRVFQLLVQVDGFLA